MGSGLGVRVAMPILLKSHWDVSLWSPRNQSDITSHINQILGDIILPKPRTYPHVHMLVYL